MPPVTTSAVWKLFSPNPNAQHHNLRVEMAAREQFFDRNESGHFPNFAHPANFAPEPFHRRPPRR